MTPPTVTLFKTIYPEFDQTDDAVIQYYLDSAAAELSQSLWGNCWPKAVMYLAAHELSLALARQAEGDSGSETPGVPATGVIASASVEGLSVSFDTGVAGNSANSAWLAQTPYGQAFAALARRCVNISTLSW